MTRPTRNVRRLWRFDPYVLARSRSHTVTVNASGLAAALSTGDANVNSMPEVRAFIAIGRCSGRPV